MRTIKITALCLLAIFCLGQRAVADDNNVTLDQARRIAAYRLAIAHGTDKYDVANARLVYKIDNPVLGIPAAYFFNVGSDGFAIVAGHRASYPFIGYSETDTLHMDRLAPAMMWWVETYCEEVIDAQIENIQPAKQVAEAWRQVEEEQLIPENSKGDRWLIDTEWDQGENTNPTYNLYCPVHYHKYTYTGCVATALGQIIRYFEFPAVGKLSKSYRPTYTVEGQTAIYEGASITINYAQTHYDYDHMPNQIYSNSDSTEIKAVALLLFHIGVAIDASYGIDGTSAVSEYTSAPLRRYFKYKSSSNIYRSSFTDEKWMDTLRYFIDKKVPVYYSAASSSNTDDRDGAGHAFICHGYHPEQTHMFRFNWGWSGSSDGWYNVANIDGLNPRSGGGGRYNFKLRQAALFGLMPPDDSNQFLGIREVASAELESAYPNPASYQVVIPYTTLPGAQAVLQVFDVTGRLMEEHPLTPGQGEQRINVSAYPKGIYLYRVQDGAMRKFIVQ